MKNLDEIILGRRTVRAFTSAIPPEDQIQSILKAGLHAPYAALAVQGIDRYRRFIVIGGQGGTSEAIRELVKKHTNKFSKMIPVLNIFLKNKIGEAFRKRLHTDLMGAAPWYIIVAEPKGFPPASLQSIAHCMENMWLKATELGLGFRLISVFESMGKNEELCRLLSLKKGTHALNGCAIGYPLAKPENSVRPDIHEITTWIQ
jgi:nitroreductase